MFSDGHLGVSGAVNEGVTEYFTRKTLGRIDNDDDRSLFGTGRQSYAKELRNVEGMRNLAKTVMTPMLAQQMQAKHTTPWAAAYPSQSPGRFAGKSPSPSNVRASEKETAGTKDFTKRAYFRGEKRMIDLLLNEDTVLDE